MLAARRLSHCRKSGSAVREETMVARLKRACMFASLAALLLGAPSARAAAALDSADFLAACVADPVVMDEPGLNEGSSVTPQVYCECVAGKFAEGKFSQTDVDMLAKMHRDEITDEDAESYPTLGDLLQANEAMQDDCKASLGMPVSEDDGEEEGPPLDTEEIPEDE
jgi:hypothetical protein